MIFKTTYLNTFKQYKSWKKEYQHVSNFDEWFNWCSSSAASPEFMNKTESNIFEASLKVKTSRQFFKSKTHFGLSCFHNLDKSRHLLKRRGCFQKQRFIQSHIQKKRHSRISTSKFEIKRDFSSKNCFEYEFSQYRPSLRLTGQKNTFLFSYNKESKEFINSLSGMDKDRPFGFTENTYKQYFQEKAVNSFQSLGDKSYINLCIGLFFKYTPIQIIFFYHSLLKYSLYPNDRYPVKQKRFSKHLLAFDGLRKPFSKSKDFGGLSVEKNRNKSLFNKPQARKRVASRVFQGSKRLSWIKWQKVLVGQSLTKKSLIKLIYSPKVSNFFRKYTKHRKTIKALPHFPKWHFLSKVPLSGESKYVRLRIQLRNGFFL